MQSLNTGEQNIHFIVNVKSELHARKLIKNWEIKRRFWRTYLKIQISNWNLFYALIRKYARKYTCKICVNNLSVQDGLGSYRLWQEWKRVSEIFHTQDILR